MNVRSISFTLLLVVTSLIVYAFSKQLMFASLEQDLKSQYLKAGDFELLYQNEAFKLSQLQGQPVILYFGYTFCPDVCPVGLSVIRDVLTSSDDFSNVRALFVSLDPERDSAARIEEYTSFFHANILGLYGNLAEITAVSSAYGTFFRKNSPTSPSDTHGALPNYTVDHSAYYYLIDTQGKLVRVLDHSTKSEEISDLLHKLL